MEKQGDKSGPMVEEKEEMAILLPCSICGRTFKEDSLKRHEAICEKTNTKKRKVFNSLKQRIQGTELAEYISLPVVPTKSRSHSVTKASSRKSSKESHHPVVDSPHAAPNVIAPTSTEKTRPTVVRSNSMNLPYTSRGGLANKEERCPHCDRTFGWKAFSRHEEWCREHKSRQLQAQSPAAVQKAKEMLEARIKYRAPLVGRLRKPTNREKYAAGVSPMSHSVIKSTVSDTYLQSIPSTNSSVSRSNKENRNKTTPKTSTVQAPGSKAAAPRRKSSTTARRDISPPKEIEHIINPPWDLNISNEIATEERESSCSSRNSFGGDKGGDQSPEEKSLFRLSTYDPYSRAEMQLKELLSDAGDFQMPKSTLSTPITESHKSPTLDIEEDNQPPKEIVHQSEDKNPQNILIHQKKAKEDILPDLFTETSTQLHFEMPNVMRGREEYTITKRRAMKPTAQNMGIELDPLARETLGGKDLTRYITEKCEKQKESLNDTENKPMEISYSFDGNMKTETEDQFDIESIHQSINVVALGLSNLSMNSKESPLDLDNNNALGIIKDKTEKSHTFDSSGNLIETEKGLSLFPHPTSSCDGESDGDSNRRRKKKKRGKASLEDDTRDDDSSPDILVTLQNPACSKLSVDSAYGSLNRPSYRTIEDAKRAFNKAFISNPPHTSSEGEDDHADEWSEEEGSKKESTRWKPEPPTIDSSEDYKMAKFCHECGSGYPLTEAKFCCVCGARRLTV